MASTAQPARYRPATRSTLYTSSITAGIHPDGPQSGQPTGVLRLMGCNLACSWCDTPFTWDYRRYTLRDEVVTLPLGDVYERLQAVCRTRLLITGGEPLLQASALGPLIHRIATEQPWRIVVETNGTLPPPSTWLFHVEQWHVSPKLPHSGMLAHRALPMSLLRVWAQLRSTIFKVVCKTTDDVQSAAELAASCGMPPERVWIMPEGVTRPTQLHNLRRIADATLAQQFNLAPRLHVLLWGNERR
jgi:7-carboxy-7-deazaguanine synthase